MPISKEEVKKVQQTMADLRAEMKKAISDAFSNMAKVLFQDHPGLESFSWTAYTQYWNDGDQCYFSANTDSFAFAYQGETFDDDERWQRSTISNDIQAFLSAFGDDDYEQLFGDHVRVTVTPTGVTTEEYTDHD